MFLKSDLGEFLEKKGNKDFILFFPSRGCLEKKSGVFIFVKPFYFVNKKPFPYTLIDFSFFFFFYGLVSLLFPWGSDNYLKITLMLLRPD